MPSNVIVIGAGASGLMAAISAARAGAEVTVLETQEKAGRKLLVTGNGRCNLTSTDPALPEQYHGSGARLARMLTAEKMDVAATLAFFHDLGLLTTEKNGGIYPYTMQASSVLDVLLAETRRLRVKMKFSQEITGIRPPHEENSAESCYQIVTPAWTYRADAVILACGSLASASDKVRAFSGACRPQSGSAKADEACPRRDKPFAREASSPFGRDIRGASASERFHSGLQLAQSLGHSIVEPRPALVPLVCMGDFSERSCAGVRCHAKVTLLHSTSRFWSVCQPRSGSQNADATCRRAKARGRFQTDTTTEVLASETGELQWTNYGLSGIVIFQLSRFMYSAKAQKEDAKKETGYRKLPPQAQQHPIVNYVVNIDFFPEYEDSELETLLKKRAGELSGEPASVLLRGFLNEKLIPLVLRRAGMGHSPAYCSEITDAYLKELIITVKNYRMPLDGTKSFDQAQICAGGVNCAEITDQLESRNHRKLYFAGEMLDVDGPCGGYNLQWAWTSGYLAGKYAAE
ncbi:MAG: NAD(P)/FAD-dependent oxidoreductase [Lachnospiraceae bacterium]|nr:NAD(P)/FAD-dependent oxidoreductase [Lachnospiraceae bacterium]